MYKVKGADGGVYGPVLGVVIQQWIAEGRLNGDSLVSPDGVEDWRPLRDYPEFVAALVSASLPSAAVGGAWSGRGSERDGALARAKTPGLLLVIFGAVLGLLAFSNVVTLLVNGPTQFPTLPPEAPQFLRDLVQMMASLPPGVMILQSVVLLLVNALIVLGGWQLMRLGNRGLAMTAGILVMVPCFTSCCCLLGLPLGIGVLRLCSAPDVRAHFRS